MIKRGKVLLVGILFLVLGSNFVSAYIDPGTGVAIGSSLIGYIAAAFGVFIAFLTRVFINPIKGFFSKIWKFIRGK